MKGPRRSSHQKKYERSKRRLREEVDVRKGREADLWEEVLRLRGLASAVREFFDGDLNAFYLEEAAKKALLWESGPGLQARLAKDRSDRVSKRVSEGPAPARSKDPLTERRYQEDQKTLRQDGWSSFPKGDEVEPV